MAVQRDFWAAFLVSLVVALQTSMTALLQSSFHHHVFQGLYSFRCSKTATEVFSMRDVSLVDSASIALGSCIKAGTWVPTLKLVIHASLEASWMV